MSSPSSAPAAMRPLIRGKDLGVWYSRDGRWTFLRAHNDPHPQRWFAYWMDDEFPSNSGGGHTRLMDAVQWARGERLAEEGHLAGCAWTPLKPEDHCTCPELRRGD